MVLSHAPTLISTFSWIFTSTNISKIALFWQWNKFYFNLLIFHCDIFYITFNLYSLLAELFTKFLFLISEYFYDEEHKGKNHISLIRNYEALRFCFGGEGGGGVGVVSFFCFLQGDIFNHMYVELHTVIHVILSHFSKHNHMMGFLYPLLFSYTVLKTYFIQRALAPIS